MLAKTPEPPYYAVIFTSVRTEVEANVTFDSAQEDNTGITVSYWKDLESIKNWKMNAEHTIARETGRSDWYQAFKVRIAKVERDYDFTK